MSWALVWDHAAKWGLLNNVGPDAAARIDEALLALAATGQGAIERIEPGDPNRFRLFVNGAEARLFVDTRARTILVTRIYRRRGP